MRARTLLVATGIVSSLLGALVVYLVLSVPNDLRADALLKQARKDITSGHDDKARESLSQIVQHYPRTDAAAAATVAIMTLAQKDRDGLARGLTMLREQNEQQARQLADLQNTVAQLRTPPPAPAPAPVTVTAPPAPKPEPKKVAPKKPAPKKKTTTRRRRR